MSDIKQRLEQASADAQKNEVNPGNIRGQRRNGAATPAVLCFSSSRGN